MKVFFNSLCLCSSCICIFLVFLFCALCSSCIYNFSKFVLCVLCFSHVAYLCLLPQFIDAFCHCLLVLFSVASWCFLLVFLDFTCQCSSLLLGGIIGCHQLLPLLKLHIQYLHHPHLHWSYWSLLVGASCVVIKLGIFAFSFCASVGCQCQISFD